MSEKGKRADYRLIVCIAGILIGFGIVGAILTPAFFLSDSQPLIETSTVTSTITKSLTLTEITTQVTSKLEVLTETITETTTMISRNINSTTSVNVTKTSPISETPDSIIISLPFGFENPPVGLQPMGETINHEAKYGGHAGIDFQWYSDKPPKIYASAKGIIVELKSEEDNPEDWTITLSHIGYDRAYYTRYGVSSPNTDLKVGSVVEKNTFLGYVPNPHPEDNMYGTHWEFGFACVGEQCEFGFQGDRLCPMTYFDEESRELIEKIWDGYSYPHKDRFPHICSGFYEERNE